MYNCGLFGTVLAVDVDVAPKKQIDGCPKRRRMSIYSKSLVKPPKVEEKFALNKSMNFIKIHH